MDAPCSPLIIKHHITWSPRRQYHPLTALLIVILATGSAPGWPLKQHPGWDCRWACGAWEERNMRSTLNRIDV